MRILSFDIGSYAVKAVELESTFGRIELADYLIEKVVETELEDVQVQTKAQEPQTTQNDAHQAQPQKVEPKPSRQVLQNAQLAAIRRILTDRQFRYDRLVVNMPRAWITTRVFNFPTKDKKTLQNSLNFELDDEVPFAMGDIVHDFAILNKEGPHSTLYTAVALRSDILALISELQTLGLDPDIITIESWSLSQILRRTIQKDHEGQPLCVVNIGHRQSSIHVCNGADPLLTHVSSCAGADVTRAIAQTYNLTFDQAEKAKVEGAFLLTQTHLAGYVGDEPLTPEQKQFSTVIGSALVPLVREIKQTLMSYKSQYKVSPRAIYITGGGSLIPNLQLYLEEQLKIPVFPFTYMSRIVGPTLRLSEASEAQISVASGGATAVAKLERFHLINFRKEGFSKRSGLGSFDLKTFKRPLKYVAATLAFIYLNLIAQALILGARSGKQDAQLERAIKSVVGAVSPSVLNTYKSSPSTLKSAVTKELAKYKDVAITPAQPQISAFDVLNKVSAAIPKDMTLDVTNFEVKEGRLKLVGVVDQIMNSNRIVKALEETKIVTEVKKDKVEEDPKTKRTTFEFSAKVAEAKPAEVKDVKTR
ncbi:MAG: pilus assembly protein PilM [Bdellovibrionota bacterium]